MAERRYIVRGEWDAEAGTWIATSDDVPGLACEAATFEALVDEVLALVPELLAANKVALPPGLAEIAVDVIAERRVTARVIA